MESLAALGLVGNIITLIDFSSKLINAASSVRHSASGLPEGLGEGGSREIDAHEIHLPGYTHTSTTRYLGHQGRETTPSHVLLLLDLGQSASKEHRGPLQKHAVGDPAAGTRSHRANISSDLLQSFVGPLHESDLDPSQLSTVFTSLLQNEVLLQKYKICFFIDGMDEFDGDHMTLARSWCSTSAIRICVSSRPHNEFVTIFGRPGPWLKLHELSRRDIYEVVIDQFAADERVTESQKHSQAFKDMANSIVNKAEGVFIWVVLTIRSLLAGIGDDCSIVQLQKRLDAVPTELEAMFRHMLDGIHQSEKKAASRVFLTRLIEPLNWMSEIFIRSLYVQAVLDDIYDNPGYEQSLLDGSLGRPLDLDECESKCVTMAKRITGRCRGLIIIAPPPHESNNRVFTMHSGTEFVHRTVADFLRQSGTIAILRDNAGDFEPCRALVLAALSGLKHETGLPDRRYTEFSGLNFPLQGKVDLLLEMCSKAEERDHLSYTQEIASMTSMLIEWDQVPPSTGITWLRLTREWMELVGPPTQFHIEINIAIAALELGCFSFIIDRLRDSKLDDIWALFGASVQLYWDYAGPRLEDLTAIITWLLENEAKLNEVVAALSGNLDYAYARPWRGRSLTLWTFLLQKAMAEMFCCSLEAREYQPNLEKCLDMLLKYGADPNVCLIGYKVTEEFVQARKHFNKMELAEKRALLKEPLTVDLATIFRSWNFSINCNDRSVNGRGRSGSLAMVPLKPSTFAGAADDRLPSTLSNKEISGADFIVVHVAPRDQIHAIQTWEVEGFLDDFLSSASFL